MMVRIGAIYYGVSVIVVYFSKNKRGYLMLVIATKCKLSWQLSRLLICCLIIASINLANANEEIEYRDQVRLKLFVSSSMSNKLLKYYAKEAALYGAVMVFKGLPDNSWHQLSEMVYDLTDEGRFKAGMQIDDLAFAKYNIKQVPQLVLEEVVDDWSQDLQNDSRLKELAGLFDQVGGNISMRRALEIISKEGDLKKQASNILKKIRIKIRE